MSEGPGQSRTSGTGRRPTVPNPALFQLPSSSSKHVTIRQPHGEDHIPEAYKYTNSQPSEHSRPIQERSRMHEVSQITERPMNKPRPLVAPTVQSKNNIPPGSTASANEPASSGRTEHLESLTALVDQQSMTPSTTWRPDVFVHAFVPQSFLAVNCAPAIQIISEGVEGINYLKYASAFASPLFLPPAFQPIDSPQVSGLPMLATGTLSRQNYGRHFIDCFMLDLKAQTPEVRSYDLFGTRLGPVDQVHEIYSLNVPGLREGAPAVFYGDQVLLRQLILDPRTNVPIGMDFWMRSGNRERGVPAPGFTGRSSPPSFVLVLRGIRTIDYYNLNQRVHVFHWRLRRQTGKVFALIERC